MNRTIRIIALFAAMSIIALQSAAAQQPVKKFDTDAKLVARVTKNLMAGLRSDNIGLKESCMRMTAQLKMRYPWADVTPLAAAIGDILATNTSGITRYKAYVTLAVCETPNDFAADTTVRQGSDETFFRSASQRMQEQLLSSAQ